MLNSIQTIKFRCNLKLYTDTQETLRNPEGYLHFKYISWLHSKCSGTLWFGHPQA